MLVKLADFGLTRTKRRSTTLVSYRLRCLQIVKWKAPELFKEYLGSSTVNSDNLGTGSDVDSDINIVNMSNDSNVGIYSNAGLRRADIYSFALTCSHVLGVQNWDLNLNWIELRKLISRGLRPQLPSGCPRSLASLISSCWAADPSCGPTFVSICKQLQVVKLEQMRYKEGTIFGRWTFSGCCVTSTHAVTLSVTCVWFSDLKVLHSDLIYAIIVLQESTSIYPILMLAIQFEWIWDVEYHSPTSANRS